MKLPPLQFVRSRDMPGRFDARMGKIVVGKTDEGEDGASFICFMPTTEGARRDGWVRALNAIEARRALTAAVADCFSWMGFR